MRIAIRTDASVEIGMGHLKRTLSLAKTLRNLGANLCFVVRAMDVDVEVLAAAEGFPVILLPAVPDGYIATSDEPLHARWARVPETQDAAETIAVLNTWCPDWIIVDHYAFDARWHKLVRMALGCHLAAIDDIADRDHDVDLLIDHTFANDHRQKYGSHAVGVPLLLGGPNYALLDPNYVDAPRNQARAIVSSVGIFMGGVDAPNFTITVLLTLCEMLGFSGAIEVATSRANPNLTQILSYAADLPNVEITTNQPNLAGFFARHELHIGAGGGATWERCCIGAPSLALVCANNQRSVLAPLQRLQVACIVDMDPIIPESLAQPIQNMIDDPVLRSRLGSNARQLVDGRGTVRVAQALIDYV